MTCELEVEINLKRVTEIMERNRSNVAEEVMKFCGDENNMIAEIYKLILTRIEVLNDDKRTPKRLADISKDTWSHILEVISDHIEDVVEKVKRC